LKIINDVTEKKKLPFAAGGGGKEKPQGSPRKGFLKLRGDSFEICWRKRTGTLVTQAKRGLGVGGKGYQGETSSGQRLEGREQGRKRLRSPTREGDVKGNTSYARRPREGEKNEGDT